MMNSNILGTPHQTLTPANYSLDGLALSIALPVAAIVVLSVPMLALGFALSTTSAIGLIRLKT
jgi:hypothetical protein